MAVLAPAARIAGERIADRIGGGIGVRSKGGDPDHGAGRDVLVDRIGGHVGVERGRNRELVDIVDGDGEGLCRRRPIGRGCGDLDARAGAECLAVDGRRGGDHAGVGVDGE